MGLHARLWFTAAQKAELWERWKNGQSAAAISAAEISGRQSFEPIRTWSCGRFRTIQVCPKDATDAPVVG
jgi:hypothetical protein